MAEEVITVYNGEEININSGDDLIPLVTSISDELLDSAEKFDNPKVAYNSPGSLIVSREVRVNMFAGHLILLPNLGVY